ncbi:UNVERIFIED_CONTAM: hypothetical protein K2H54_018723 [Gekko kuhli]
MEARNVDFWSQNIDLWKKIRDLLEKFKIIVQLEDLNQNHKEKVSTSWGKIWKIYKMMEAGNLEFWEKNIYGWKNVEDVLGKIKKIIPKEALIQIQTEKVSSLWEDVREIYKTGEARNMDFWVQNINHWKKFMDLLEKVKKILVKEDLNQNHKEELSTLWEETCEIYKNMEARNLDFWERNVDLWEKIGDLLEKVEKIFQEDQGPWKDAVGGLGKEKDLWKDGSFSIETLMHLLKIPWEVERHALGCTFPECGGHWPGPLTVIITIHGLSDLEETSQSPPRGEHDSPSRVPGTGTIALVTQPEITVRNRLDMPCFGMHSTSLQTWPLKLTGLQMADIEPK